MSPSVLKEDLENVSIVMKINDQVDRDEPKLQMVCDYLNNTNVMMS